MLRRPHIPYRNSMMTMVLKDSLGGNCRTVMVANINPDQSQLDESISTCRFAMRVALVRNQVRVHAHAHTYHTYVAFMTRCEYVHRHAFYIRKYKQESLPEYHQTLQNPHRQAKASMFHQV